MPVPLQKDVTSTLTDTTRSVFHDRSHSNYLCMAVTFPTLNCAAAADSP